MDFFGIGPLEILVILIVALIIFGPGRLPEIGRTVGKAMRTLRKASFDLSTQLTKEIEGKENSHPAGQKQKGSSQTGASEEHHGQDTPKA